MNDAELELHISSLATLIERAMADGDCAAARAWAATRAEAIKSRSPEQVQAMEAALGLGPCQFTVMAEADRAGMGAHR